MKQKRSVPKGAWPIPDDAPEVDIELTPGKVIKAKLPKDVPHYALFGVVEDGKGGYKIAPAIYPQWLPMGHRIASQLGIPVHRNTLRRLILMGAVEACLPSPGVILIDAASLLKHLRRTRIKPGQTNWWNKARRMAWQESREGRPEDITPAD
ncbi:hypothetical protein [Prosthecobacter dejongeii]|uniref:Uncharacterized protein n=1 Tax=Prosthecobacter dejongeii TaxID=48465 RepID=A0A7W8DPB0_9BACT|nr:hypothetical protein [Prosthecobacter dejongeii]MBB5037142.1 hypothetical protein [Prosthecobacter dejongeii]